MLSVFGAICTDIYIDLEEMPNSGQSCAAQAYHATHGGKAANQALAAVRAGAKTALIGCVGDDMFSRAHTEKLRREEILTSGISKNDERMGTRLYIHEPHKEKRTIIASGANAHICTDQVPDSFLTPGHFLLLQTEINNETNAKMLERAKAQGAETFMNLSPAINLSQRMLENLDYLIINHREALKLAEKLSLAQENCMKKMAQALATQGQLNCIITMGAKGSIAYSKDQICWSVGALELEELIDKTGAEDAYCGTLVGCLYNKMPLPEAMKRASIAASLTCTKQGGQNAFPFMGDIDERINDLPDAEQITV